MHVPVTLHRMLSTLAVLGLSTSPATATAADSVDPFDGDWHFSLTPYLWLPNVNGTLNGKVPGANLNLPDFNVSTEIGPNDYLEKLKFGAMASGEVRKGEWSAFTDIIYIDFGNQDSRVRNITYPDGRPLSDINVKATTDLSATVWTLGGARTLVHNRKGNLDLLAGFRYVGIASKVKLNTQGTDGLLDLDRNKSRDLTEWDGILGVKGQIRFGDGRWTMPYYLDVGTGSSNWTWQALVGVGYAFDWGEVSLSIRSLSYDFNDKHDADLRMTGPALGASFRW
ncbi:MULTISPECIES: hypothetical protein [Thiorhodovibrio]|uniref:hypothetical protein n=1 Tax=Thiorhodovibrio TaxID=61593 RepID=UPI001913BF8C|nr:MULTISPECIES: hypothetical protein [Thiorhodovibrio]MBK5967581.1 hypothetical protein [Thiorhodovibrio winogradskyi]WPL14931.1 hypothetical protein Thiosp_04787 [Thiorhodovibrio litoralis]